jgi:haloalkane dehalogenase
MRSTDMYRELNILGSTMAYAEAGSNGPVALFLHGNPTSSYIWRNIIPHVATKARCIAPDMIGFGRSGKPDIDYRFVDHVRYLDAFIDALHLKDFVLVAQDWGTALAFHYARRHRESVIGLAFMEYIRPMRTWNDFHQKPEARALFQAIRTPGQGEQMVLEGNVFVERVLPGSVLRKLTEEEMEAYRAPFPTAQSRKPILQLPRELPIAGEPADVAHVLDLADAALRASQCPKLIFCGDPGALVSPVAAAEYAQQLHHCRVVSLGPGAHYLQEDHPDRIGTELAGWIDEIVSASLGVPEAQAASTHGVPCE